MTDKNITFVISEYISKQKISITKIHQDTGIKEEKLQMVPKDKLTATELLDLCAYLNVKPEEFLYYK